MWKKILAFALGFLMSRESMFVIGKLVSSVGRKKFGSEWESKYETPFIQGLKDDNE